MSKNIAKVLAELTESVPAEQVGAHLESREVDGVVLHSFAAVLAGYPSWYWEVAAPVNAPDHILEAVLLPGPEALVPPAWRPWAQRIEPGDIGPGDLLPTNDDDPRLTAGFAAIDDEIELLPREWELGLGREQVLSAVGLDRAVDRWMSGVGPRSAMAKSAPAPCSTCGFLVAIGGSLGQAFGVCGNEYGAQDGHIVAMNYGCGAHSSVREVPHSPVPVVGLVVDDEFDEIGNADDLAEFVSEDENLETAEEPMAEDDLHLSGDPERVLADIESLADEDGPTQDAREEELRDIDWELS